jgi:hypothetical protein
MKKFLVISLLTIIVIIAIIFSWFIYFTQIPTSETAIPILRSISDYQKYSYSPPTNWSDLISFSRSYDSAYYTQLLKIEDKVWPLKVKLSQYDSNLLVHVNLNNNVSPCYIAYDKLTSPIQLFDTCMVIMGGFRVVDFCKIQPLEGIIISSNYRSISEFDNLKVYQNFGDLKDELYQILKKNNVTDIEKLAFLYKGGETRVVCPHQNILGEEIMKELNNVFSKMDDNQLVFVPMSDFR